MAVRLERLREHPLARAIVSAAEERKLPLSAATEFRAISGGGVLGFVSGKRVVAGTPSFLREQGIEIPGEQPAPDRRQNSSAATPVYAAVDGRPVGVILLSDRIKPSAPEGMRALRADGIRLVMLTGDPHAVAAIVASQLGIEDVEAEVQPQQKAEIVKRLREQGPIVAMAADSLNDAPALAGPPRGIRMGTGTDLAI